MDNDEKLETLMTLFPDGWNMELTNDGATITNKNGESLDLIMNEESIVIGDKSFNYINYEASLPLLVSFIYQCFDNEQRM